MGRVEGGGRGSVDEGEGVRVRVSAIAFIVSGHDAHVREMVPALVALADLRVCVCICWRLCVLVCMLVCMYASMCARHPGTILCEHHALDGL